MSNYYLVAQLPSLDGISESTSLPINEEQFTDLCNRFASKRLQEALKKLTLSPSRFNEYSGSVFIDEWNDSERNLRFALGKVRAEKMNKVFDTENRILSVDYIKVASSAIEIKDPMEAEKYLNKYRLAILEGLRPLDCFSEDYILYYGLKLKLLLRIKQFDATSGEKAYKNIYYSILNGDSMEAE